MTRRRYTDDDRAAALAALAANEGEIPRTARDLGIPENTLRQWARGQRHPEALQMSEGKKRDLADLLDEVARALVGDLLDEARRRDASFRDLSVAAGIAIDKMQLLRGRPTSITQTDLAALSDAELLRIASGSGEGDPPAEERPAQSA